MRIFALSDLHVDYEENRKWVYGLSLSEYQKDILVLAGDITDKISSLEKTFYRLKKSFSEILYIPGNHDLWVFRDSIKDSIEKCKRIKTISSENGIRMEPYKLNELSIIPLYAWYDYSFGLPSQKILSEWVDLST